MRRPPDRSAAATRPRLPHRLPHAARATLLLALVALAYTGPGVLPGHRVVPLDLLSDFGAWKPDPDERRGVSNRLLADVVLQFLPWDVEVRRHLAAGDPPWVDRWSGGGTPLFANPQTAVFSPFTWPRLVLGEHGWALTVFLRFAAAGLAAFWLARTMGAGRRAALFSGFVYMSSGHAVIWSLHPIANVTACLPAVAASMIRLSREASPRAVTLVAGSAALATAGGHPESLMMGMLAIFAFLVWDRWGKRADGLLWCAASALVGFLLLAVVNVPFLLVLADSEVAAMRAGGHPGGLRLVAVAAQVLPGFLGGPLGAELDLSRLGPPEETFLMRSGGFVGALVLTSLLLAARRLPPTFQRGLAVGGVALVLSWRPPVVETLLGHIPLLPWSYPSYRAVGFVLFAAAAAGPALAAATTLVHRRSGGFLIAAGGLLLPIGLLPSLPPARDLVVEVSRAGVAELHGRGLLPNPMEVYERRLPEYLEAVESTALRRWAMPAACWGLAGLALAVGGRHRRRLLAMAIVGELAAFAVGYVPAVPATSEPPDPPTIAAIRRLDPEHRFQLVAGRGVYPPNLATRSALRDARSYVVLEGRGAMDSLRRLGYQPGAELSFRPDLRPAQLAGLAARGVRFFLSREPVQGARRIAGDAPPAVGLYEIPGARPVPLPENRAPRGLLVGAVLSLAALVAGVALAARARRILLSSPPADRVATRSPP